MFKIAATKYVVRDKSYEIYVSGCEGIDGKHCKGCHNPKLWDPEIGFPYEDKMAEVSNTLSTSGEMIDSIRIYGGELLEKEEWEIRTFLEDLKRFKKPLWLFTRFEFEEVPSYILEEVAYVKCGFYDETKRAPHESHGVTLWSLNQQIYKKGEDY